MLSQRLLPLLLTAAAIALPACSSDDQITDPPARLTRRIVDFSFETTTGKPSVYGWFVPADTTVAGVVVGAPPGGGIYSLWMKGLGLPPQFSETRIPAVAGTHRYDLSFTARTEGEARGGSAQLFLFGKNGTVDGASIQFTDSLWRSYAITDTLTAVQGDTLAVRLVGPGTGLAVSGHTYFDLIRLEVEE